MFNFKDRVVAITGASSGLGVQMAHGFAEQGADLVLLARRREKLQSVAKEIEEKYQIKVLPFECDVTKLDSIKDAVQASLKIFGKIDVLINNAGVGSVKPAEEMDDETWEYNLAIDLTGVFRTAREFGKVMLEAGYGRIINVSSMYGMVGNSESPAAAYHAAKGGVVNLTRALAAEWSRRGITVNCLCPGYFETELTKDTLNTESFKAYMERTVPLGRYGKWGELNAAACFLASDEASYVTGVILPVDGGYTCV
ncbi:MAG: SDR family oxidoreductase [Desulfitobacterium sp.]|nr:SDR family oxidoreductase [Desulfitobacterium sp.]